MSFCPKRLLILLVFLLLCPLPAQAQGKVVFVIIDRINLADLHHPDLKHINELIAAGSLGLMNTNTAKSRDAQHTYLTIGAGKPAVGGTLQGQAFQRESLYLGQKVPTLYRSLNQKQVGNQAIMHLGFPELHNLNQSTKYQAQPGNLGSVLQQHHHQTAVLGNGDLFSAPMTTNRLAVTIAANENGLVDYGDVSPKLLAWNPSFPWCFSSNFPKLFNTYRQLVGHADFFVLETGDTARLDAYQPLLPPTRYSALKKETLQKIDQLVGRIRATINPSQDLLFLFAPTSSKSALQAGNSLTPVIIFGKSFAPGLLYSPTTHRAGILSNLDLAPTVLDFFALPSNNDFAGKALSSQTEKQSMTKLLTLNEQIIATGTARSPVLKAYIMIQIVTLFVALSAIFLAKKLPDLFYACLEEVLFGLLLVPVLLLISPLFQLFATRQIFCALMFSIMLFILFRRVCTVDFLTTFILIGLFSSGVILVDLLTGNHLLRASLLSYDPMIGARFYGIGNEYSGVLLGSSLLGIAALLQKYAPPKRSLLVSSLCFFLLITFISSSPRFGADAGGAITCITAYLLVSFKLLDRKITGKTILFICMATLTVLTLMCLYDLHKNSGEVTHIGRAISAIRTEGLSSAYEIIQNKIATNLRLIRYTIWSRFLITTLFVLAILFVRPIGIIKKIFDTYPYLGKGFIGISIASIVGLIVNDSGVVQAATTILYGIYPLIILFIKT